MTVGEKIYTLRTQAGYSQEEFAEIIGVSRQSISKWETSVVMPDTEYIVKICKTLHVSADTLIMDGELTSGTIQTSHIGNLPETPRQEGEIQQSSGAQLAPTTQDDDAERYEANKALSIAGFVLSFFWGILGLIFSSIVVNREKHSRHINHLAVSGIAISCANIYASIVCIAVFGILSLVYGGAL